MAVGRRNFSHAVAALPQGAVVLPGLDTDLDDDAWQLIGGIRSAQGKISRRLRRRNHPQFAMHAGAGKIRHQARRCRDPRTPAPHGRGRAGVRGDAAIERDSAMASSGWASLTSSRRYRAA